MASFTTRIHVEQCVIQARRIGLLLDVAEIVQAMDGRFGLVVLPAIMAVATSPSRIAQRPE